MLTKSEILKQLEAGRITITPFKPEHLGPNSYDVTLSDKILIVGEHRCSWEGQGIWDVKSPPPLRPLGMEKGAFILDPGNLYLASTVESACSKYFVPMLYGRSSLARLGISIHREAGFGDLGWGWVAGDKGVLQPAFPQWTLEITVTHTIRIYPGMKIGQVAFHKPTGNIEHLYEGKYSSQQGPQASLIHRDFQ